MTDADRYAVAIKPSAWRISAALGEWVNRNGPERAFGTKALAREWARECAGRGTSLWVQDAVPWDGSDVDGYLVGSRDRSGGRGSGGRGGSGRSHEGEGNRGDAGSRGGEGNHDDEDSRGDESGRGGESGGQTTLAGADDDPGPRPSSG